MDHPIAPRLPKPRIAPLPRKLFRNGLAWRCFGRGYIGLGTDPADAYRNWLRGVLTPVHLLDSLAPFAYSTVFPTHPDPTP